MGLVPDCPSLQSEGGREQAHWSEVRDNNFIYLIYRAHEKIGSNARKRLLLPRVFGCLR